MTPEIMVRRLRKANKEKTSKTVGSNEIDNFFSANQLPVLYPHVQSILETRRVARCASPLRALPPSAPAV